MKQRRIVARSFSRPVREWLEGGPGAVHVLAVFERACDLVTSDGEVIALVSPQIGDGPLNVVLDRTPSFLGRVSPGTEVVCDADRLLFSSVGEHDKWHVFEINADGTGLRQMTPSLPDVQYPPLRAL